LHFDEVIAIVIDDPSLVMKHGSYVFYSISEFKVFLSDNLWFVGEVLNSNEWTYVKKQNPAQ
jgi:hypothetical protein